MIKREIEASKYHCYGNDFLVLDMSSAVAEELGPLSKAICDPHFGFGADGTVFIEFSYPLHPRLKIYNRDGSEATMSGNGARCAAAYLVHQKQVSESHIELSTASGVKVYQPLDSGHDIWRFRSEMGRPSFEPQAVPCQAESLESPIPLEVAGRTVEVRPLSVGNPQCAVMVDQLPDDEEFHRIGAGLEVHPFFPDRTNVSFIKVIDRSRLSIRIWERGVGPTCSSGTGSCGAAVAAIRAGLADSPVVVETSTGSQHVSWKPEESVFLTGQCWFVGHLRFVWRG